MPAQADMLEQRHLVGSQHHYLLIAYNLRVPTQKGLDELPFSYRYNVATRNACFICVPASTETRECPSKHLQSSQEEPLAS